VEIAFPPGVVILIEPVVALLGTVASTWVADVQWRAVADLEPKLTAVFPLIKFVPVIVTKVPTPTSVGVKLEIVGAGYTVKVAPVAVYAGLPPQAVGPEPPEVIIVIAPVVVLASGMIVIFLVSGFQASKIFAVTPPILTTVLSPASSAVISILVNKFPLVGVNEIIFGGDTKVKALLGVVAEVAPPVVTLT